MKRGEIFNAMKERMRVDYFPAGELSERRGKNFAMVAVE